MPVAVVRAAADVAALGVVDVLGSAQAARHRSSLRSSRRSGRAPTSGVYQILPRARSFRAVISRRQDELRGTGDLPCSATLYPCETDLLHAKRYPSTRGIRH